ncbi:MAG TPA: UDP-N-acetylglucosamine 2-epimerase (non-hydrolyzing) [Actinobacteria bacterium]|nr:UDP-N-acetylglucosamine 2-epimerase (non-hydrolyzing) [Actinomycetota bacterium]
MATPTTAPPDVVVVLGTRPEIVKLAGIVRLLGDAARVVHTGQHYDDNLSDVFLAELGLPEPAAYLGVGGERRGRQIGLAVERLDELFARRRPDAVVVQGDTNAVLAAAIAANAAEVPLVHVEAGLRSYDRRMPEEHNRVVADHLGDLLLAPTETNRENLLAEGIPPDRIVVTGNTVVEAVTELLPAAEERAEVLARHGVEPARYVLATFHRPENVDDPEILKVILGELASLPIPVILPMHPRTRRRIVEHGFAELAEAIRVVSPVGYREFLALGAESAFLVSDSGGVQEEVSVYKRPVLVVRRSTERPEVLGTFAERVLPGPAIGEIARRWLADLDALHAHLAPLPSPYGDGSASARSVAAIEELLGA